MHSSLDWERRENSVAIDALTMSVDEFSNLSKVALYTPHAESMVSRGQRQCHIWGMSSETALLLLENQGLHAILREAQRHVEK